MSTRGLYGFHKSGIDKLTYNHLDSYPDWLGKKIVEFCKCAGRDGMNSLFDHIELVSEDAMPSPKQIEYCMEHDLGVDGGDWDWTLRPNQGCPENWLPFIDSGLKIYMIDSLPFIKDSLMCEYAYIVNLDTDQLEFYCGFQHKIPRSLRAIPWLRSRPDLTSTARRRSPSATSRNRMSTS